MGEKNKTKIHGIFISGPMTGLENYNFDKFNEVAARLIRAGYNVINPVNICKKFKQEEVVKHKEVFDAMVAEQQAAERNQCDAILLLDGWELSLGVRLELQTAIELKFQIFLEKDLPWLCDDDKESEEDQKVDPLHYESLKDKSLEKATARTSDPELDKMFFGAKLLAFDAIIEEHKKRNEDYATIKAERDQFELDDLISRVERYLNDMHLRYELGSLQVRYGYYDEAIKHLKIAQKSPKDRLEALYLLAKCFIAKGQRDLGVMQLETAKDAIPTMTDLKKRVIYELALCAEDTGDDKKAYELYKEIYSNDVTFEDVEGRLMTIKKILDMNPKKTENLEV